jgi:CheY-like chemotaxis protein
MEELRAMLESSDSWVLPEDPPDPPIDPSPVPRLPHKLDANEKRSKTVLVVEDDIDVRSTVLEILAEDGYGAVAVRNGVEAIRYLHYTPRKPDLILLDLMMPVMDGWELKKRLERNPEWKDIPVIIYSANVRAKPISATVVLSKPISLAQLMDTIETHIKKKED